MHPTRKTIDSGIFDPLFRQILSICFFANTVLQADPVRQNPNIILIYADDFHGDLAVMGILRSTLLTWIKCRRSRNGPSSILLQIFVLPVEQPY